MAMISLHDVTKVYQAGARPALSHVNLTIERGEFVFLVGASGSGKTTLLQLLLHEQEANEGEIHVAGTDLRRIPNRLVPKYRRNLGFVFQDYKLLAGKTVWENVAFALQVIGARRSVIRSLVPQALEMVGLTGMEDRLPHELSGGEAQRVAIARAYVNHPQILLADEPTGNLDPSTSVGIMQVLDTINRTSNTTIVMATHNEEIVNSMRKRVVEVHLGKIVRDEEHGRYDSSLYNPDHHNVGARRGAGVSNAAGVSRGASVSGSVSVSRGADNLVRNVQASLAKTAVTSESELPSLSEADSQNTQVSQVSNPTGEQAVVHAAATGAETPATGEQDVASGEQAQAQVEQPLAQAKTAQTSVAAPQESDDAEQASEEASEQTSKETSQDTSQQANKAEAAEASKPLNPPAAPDTITELARNLRSGHTGRYGEVFQSAEDTMTWGMGLDDGLDDGSDDKEGK